MERIDRTRVGKTLGGRIGAASARQARMRGEDARYSLVLHAPRKNLGLNLNEYVLADNTIHKLSSVHSAVSGWCYASKEKLAESLGLTDRTVYRMLKRLEELNLIETHPQSRHIRTTKAWYQAVEVVKRDSLRPQIVIPTTPCQAP